MNSHCPPYLLPAQHNRMYTVSGEREYLCKPDSSIPRDGWKHWSSTSTQLTSGSKKAARDNSGHTLVKRLCWQASEVLVHPYSPAGNWAPSALAGTMSKGGNPDQGLQPKSDMQNHLVPSCCTMHFISLHEGDSKIVTMIRCLSSGDPSWRKREGGPSPQRGPPSATGGHLTSSCPARRRGVRVGATDLDETPTSRSINSLQWNAEGAYNNKIALSERLHQENIDVACLQETHLKDNQHFVMRGYQVFWHDREDRAKGGIAILVKNTIPAQELTVVLTTRQKFLELAS